MYQKALAKFVKKSEKYKKGKPNKYYKYQELGNNANQSLKIIQNTL